MCDLDEADQAEYVAYLEAARAHALARLRPRPRRRVAPSSVATAASPVAAEA
ncbi:MAG TPA: hypothetical protein VMH49_02735 [Thermoplasmata archaeon]|nr:hypothetical protein [Thermoplasmata archaeon]